MTFLGRSAGRRLRQARDGGDRRAAVVALLPVVAVVAWLAGRFLAEPVAGAILPDAARAVVIALGVAALVLPGAAMACFLRLDRPTSPPLRGGRLVGAVAATTLLGLNGLWISGLRLNATPEGLRARFGEAYRSAEPFLVGVGAGLLTVIAGALVLWLVRRRAASAPHTN